MEVQPNQLGDAEWQESRQRWTDLQTLKHEDLGSMKPPTSLFDLGFL